MYNSTLLPGGNVKPKEAKSRLDLMKELGIVIGQFSFTPPKRPKAPFQATSHDDLLSKVDNRLKVQLEDENGKPASHDFVIQSISDLSLDGIARNSPVIRRQKRKKEVAEALKAAMSKDKNPAFRLWLEDLLAQSKEDRAQVRQQIQALREAFQKAAGTNRLPIG